MPIVLVPYDPKWTKAFERASDELEAELDPGTFVDIEHIGSTSVPGIAAKPIVDMVAAVPDLADVAALGPKLERIGFFADRIPPIPGGFSFVRYGDGENSPATEHLHIVLKDGPKWSALIRFRDRLRAHKGDRVAYERLKRRLAAEYDDTRSYSDAKTDFVETILSDR